MGLVKKIIHELNYLKWKDIGQIFVFIISIPVSLIYKIYISIAKKEIWLICEDPMEARDNGICFFKYVNEHSENINSYYAISPHSQDYAKVKKIGKIVSYGSMFHWVLYFSCKYNISSQKGGKPNAAICYVLEVFGILKSKSVFLQHGITLNKGEWLFYENTKIRLFICGAKPEYDYIKENFGYPESNLAYLGFCRFDDYHKIQPNRKQIVLMPSWREWIASKNEYSSVFEDTSDFTQTEYYQKYQSLINNKELIVFLKENDLILYFYPHRNMQKYIHLFSTESEHIKIVTNKNSDIRDLLMTSAAMITDYSSVALDFAYMRKPVIYYQFDEKRFRQAQYAEGYYNYRTAGLGKVCTQESEVIIELKAMYEQSWQMTEEFERAHKEFFPLFDDENSKRTYEKIKSLR